MMTLKQFAEKPETIPASTSWYLADLGEEWGRSRVRAAQKRSSSPALSNAREGLLELPIFTGIVPA